MKIIIHIPQQTLDLLDDSGKSIRHYLVSTGANGVGEENGSFCTPRGKHYIRAKIGAGQPENSVFVKRRPTEAECPRQGHVAVNHAVLVDLLLAVEQLRPDVHYDPLGFRNLLATLRAVPRRLGYRLPF